MRAESRWPILAQAPRPIPSPVSFLVIRTENIMTIVRPLLVLVPLMLGACGSPSQEPPPPVKDTAFGGMTDAMDRARGVEATTMQQKADMDRALQESEKP
jgi:hypothetical protein